ncbi:hypothetical protein [Cystobacter ferrugineus]|uniref:Uncharacterized protein n=1 Tax=Cystobacter ferrugineus TaxID=83449 RepID=A0A1L9B3X5_9BACT|nr:hypothetical protein [Cystobacter ferrugineus]OJH36948.1 hypothetical protein BON30_31140 [Cystobacter ferrugineus]
MRSLMVALLLSLPPSALADPLVVLPNTLVVAEEDGRQFISVRENGSRIEASIQFVTNWSESVGLLRARHGEGFYDLEVVKVDVLPTRVELSSSFFTQANPALVDIRFEYGVNRVTVRLRFNRDYDVGQIREALIFPVSLGTVDARVLCLGSAVSPQCDTDIKRIPLINPRAARMNPGENLPRAHYVYLRAYATQLMMTSTPYLSEAFSNTVRARYWAGGNCEQVGIEWHRDACLIARRYSSTSHASLGEAIMGLGPRLYSEASFEDGEGFLVEGAHFGLRQLNSTFDFDRLRQKLEQEFVLENSVRNIRSALPLVNPAEALHRWRFDIQGNALSWRGRKIALASGSHMRGETQFLLSTRGRKYRVPVSYNVHLGFTYDPLARKVTLDDVHVENLKLLGKDVPGYNPVVRYRSDVEIFINGYFTSAQEKAKITRSIEVFLTRLQNEHTGLDPFLNP